MWYADAGGSGVPIAFVHPAATHSDCWQYQLPAFSAAGYRCITYNLRGFPGSPTAPGADPGTLSDDLESLRVTLNVERFVLIGAAYGGFGALDYALRFQDRLLALVLATTQGGVVDPEYVAVRERAVTPEIRALPVELRELGPSYRAEDPEGAQRWLQLHVAPSVRQRTHLQITLPMLEALRVPTLLLAAGADLLAPPSLMRQIARRVANSEFVTLPDAGHSAHWERPATWNEIVLEFLGHQLPGG